MTTYKEYKINGGECTFTAHLRLPWIDSVKQHELSSKCCEYIKKPNQNGPIQEFIKEDTTIVEILEWLYSTS